MTIHSVQSETQLQVPIRIPRYIHDVSSYACVDRSPPFNQVYSNDSDASFRHSRRCRCRHISSPATNTCPARFHKQFSAMAINNWISVAVQNFALQLSCRWPWRQISQRQVRVAPGQLVDRLDSIRVDRLLHSDTVSAYGSIGYLPYEPCMFYTEKKEQAHQHPGTSTNSNQTTEAQQNCKTQNGARDTTPYHDNLPLKKQRLYTQPIYSEPNSERRASTCVLE